ncbi:hypothetical protein [Streptomyces sp. I6]|uniref:hypothetical protein n=1 Tax=Streptomyces sp. I6 TaxID=2483113 RepID=UPI000F44CDBC|nr:hypothetical protein [Streptomyces sp. I6]RNL70601.1 hypothetical protein EBF04_04880 [Streptomyces sp. I6]
MSDSIHTPPAAHEASGAAQGGAGEPFPAPGPAAGLPGARHAVPPGDGAPAALGGTGSTAVQDATGAGPVAKEPAYEPAAPAPLGVARVTTGHTGVDAHLERLGDADHLPAGGHLEVYEDVHRGLRDTLTALDARPEDPYDPRS